MSAAPIPAVLVGLRETPAAPPRLPPPPDGQKMFVALHTADGEAKYDGYAPAVIDRANWSLEIDSAGRPSFSNAEPITFPRALSGPCVVAFGVLFDPHGGRFAFPLAAPLTIGPGITPSFGPKAIRLA